MRCWTRPLLTLPLVFALAGCLNTLASVATAPVRVVGKAVDLATTSQSETDQTRGRRLREREERLGRLSRELDQADRRCGEGRESACDDVERLRREIMEVEREPV